MLLAGDGWHAPGRFIPLPHESQPDLPGLRQSAGPFGVQETTQATDGPAARSADGPPATEAAPFLVEDKTIAPTSLRAAGYSLRSSGEFLRGATGKAVEVHVSVTGGGGVDHAGRVWTQHGDGETWTTTELTVRDIKSAFQLRTNIEAFSEHYQRSRCGLLTLTPEWAGITPKEFGQAFHHMRKHGMEWLVSYIRVLEPQVRGAPHYHLLAATPYDLKPDEFDWDALFGAQEARQRGDLAEARCLTRRYAEKAPPELRAIWAEVRALCRRYGLGRSEFLPLRKDKQQVGEYIGSYLEAGLRIRREGWKGCRRVEYDRRESLIWKACQTQFSSVSVGARIWRRRLAEYATAHGCSNSDQLRQKLGPRWCFRIRKKIMTATELEWTGFVRCLGVATGAANPF